MTAGADRHSVQLLSLVKLQVIKTIGGVAIPIRSTIRPFAALSAEPSAAVWSALLLPAGGEAFAISCDAFLPIVAGTTDTTCRLSTFNRNALFEAWVGGLTNTLPRAGGAISAKAALAPVYFAALDFRTGSVTGVLQTGLFRTANLARGAFAAIATIYLSAFSAAASHLVIPLYFVDASTFHADVSQSALAAVALSHVTTLASVADGKAGVVTLAATRHRQ